MAGRKFNLDRSSCNKLLLFVSCIEAGDASSGCSPPLNSNWPVLSPLLEPHSPSTNLSRKERINYFYWIFHVFWKKLIYFWGKLIYKIAYLNILQKKKKHFWSLFYIFYYYKFRFVRNYQKSVNWLRVKVEGKFRFFLSDHWKSL